MEHIDVKDNEETVLDWLNDFTPEEIDEWLGDMAEKDYTAEN